MQVGIGLSLTKGGALFSPLSFFAAGEQGGWWDPSDFSTMFQDTGGTTPVTATGQSVALIRDKSGRGNHRTQSTAASRPTLQQDASGYYYLSYDGADDFMVTGSVDFSSADEVCAFVGIRKDTDAAIALFCELTVNAGANAGSFNITAPNAAAATAYSARTGGSTSVSASVSGYAAPTSNVVSFTADISGDSLVLRVNGVQGASVVLDQGTGNFSSAALYFGRRAGATLPFAGREYQTIIRGALPTAAQLAQAERFVGARMGIAL